MGGVVGEVRDKAISAFNEVEVEFEAELGNRWVLAGITLTPNEVVRLPSLLETWLYSLRSLAALVCRPVLSAPPPPHHRGLSGTT